jgi:hypothetical protein
MTTEVNPCPPQKRKTSTVATQTWTQARVRCLCFELCSRLLILALHDRESSNATYIYIYYPDSFCCMIIKTSTVTFKY